METWRTFVREEDLRETFLMALLQTIARQNNHTIPIAEAEYMIRKHKWLRGFLIAKWQGRSFTEVRRLSECPLCTFAVNKFK